MAERRNHSRSVYPDEEAAEFMPWLIKLWDGLTPAEKASAGMVARQSIGMVMVGIEYTVEKPAVTNGDREAGA